MKNKNIILIIMSLITVLSVFAGINKVTLFNTPVVASSTPSPTPRVAKYITRQEMPPQIMYLQLFKHISVLKQMEAKSQSQGFSSSWTSTFYSEKLGLTSSQSQIIDNEVADCLQKVQNLDQQAESIITNARAQFPNGDLAGKSLPPPPPQLYALQTQKDNIVLAAKANLEQQFGSQKFIEFNDAVIKNVTQMAVPLNLSTHQVQRNPLLAQ